MKYINFNNSKQKNKNTYKIYDDKYSNLKLPNINDKNYIYWKNIKESIRCIEALPDLIYSDEHVTYLLTMTFEANEIKANKYDIEKHLNSFVFKVDRTLQSRLKKPISRAIVFFEDSFYTSNSGTYSIPHIHAFYQIPTEYHEKFKAKCISGSFETKTRVREKSSYALCATLLDDKKSILTVRDSTLYLVERKEEIERWLSYDAKWLNEAGSSFGYEDILIIQNTIKDKNRTLNNRTSSDGRYLPA